MKNTLIKRRLHAWMITARVTLFAPAKTLLSSTMGLFTSAKALFAPAAVTATALFTMTLAMLLPPTPAAAREPVGTLAKPPVVALKTNLLYDALTTFNLGVEVRLSQRLTLDVPVNYNPWTFSDNTKIKHVMVQPELRYWINEPFNGHYFGANLLWSLFNEGNIPTPQGMREALGYGNLQDYRYEGNLYGVGISYGYHWMLSPRFSLEATAGLGYVFLDYSRFECAKCGEKLGNESRHYFGPTKLGLSLIYMIK